MKLESTAIIALLLLSPLATSLALGGTTIDYGRSWPRSIVVDSSRGLVYIDAMSGIYPPTGFSFGIINASDHRVQRVIPLNVSAGEMTLDRSSGDVYVAGGESIAVYDARSQSFSRTLEVGRPILGIAYAEGSAHLYVTSGDRVLQVDPLSGEVVAEATVGADAYGMAIDPSSGKLYVANYLSGSVSVLNDSNLATLGVISLPAPSYPSQILLDSQRRVAYVTTGSNSVDVLDLEGDKFERSFSVAPPFSNSILTMALNQEAGVLFVLTAPGTTVTQVDGATGEPMGRFNLGSGAYEMAVNQGTGELYVTWYHMVSVFDPDYGRPLPYWLSLLVLTGGAAALAATWFVISLRRGRGRLRRPR